MPTGETPRSKRLPLVIALIGLILVLCVLLVPRPRSVKSSYRLTPASTLTLLAQRDGIIGEIKAPNGAVVTRGALIATYDVSALEKKLPVLEQQLAVLEKQQPQTPNWKARAALAKAERALKAADAALEKAQKASKGERTPALRAAEKDQKTAALAVLRATPPFGSGLTRREIDKKLAETKEAIASARDAIASANIVAPASGVLTLLALEQGKPVARDATIATVVDSATLKAVVKVPAGEEVHKGMAVVLTLPGGGSHRAIFDTDLKGDVAEAALDNAGGQFSAGTQGDADIEATERSLVSRP
jgi:multidrug efflux pump subunit AcrA (membrane-fusion protein)